MTGKFMAYKMGQSYPEEKRFETLRSAGNFLKKNKGYVLFRVEGKNRKLVGINRDGRVMLSLKKVM